MSSFFMRKIGLRKKKYVVLRRGIGNRLNGIFNHIHDPDVVFIWFIGKACRARWDEIFTTKINVIYDKTHAKSRMPASHIFSEDTADLEKVKNFIWSLEVTPEVKRYQVPIPFGTPGFAIRALHPKSYIDPGKVKVPKGCFLVTDSKEIRENNPLALRNDVEGAMEDCAEEIRGIEGVRQAVADWKSLFSCSKIYEIGFPKQGFGSQPRTTFIDAHKICRMAVTNLTHNFLK